MRIRQKLILGFAGMASLFGIVEVACITVSQKILQNSMGGSAVRLSVETMEALNRLRNIALGLTVVLVLLGILLSLHIVKTAWKPLSKLRMAMRKIADGDLDIRMDIHRNDEIGELADAFNHMGEQLRNAREALDVSQGQFNAMLRSISDDIALIDKDLNIIWTNIAASEMYGDDIIGKKCYEVYHQRTSPCEPYPCPTIKAFYDNQVHQYETMLKDKDGRIRYLHCVANVALRDE